MTIKKRQLFTQTNHANLEATQTEREAGARWSNQFKLATNRGRIPGWDGYRDVGTIPGVNTIAAPKVLTRPAWMGADDPVQNLLGRVVELLENAQQPRLSADEQREIQRHSELIAQAEWTAQHDGVPAPPAVITRPVVFSKETGKFEDK